MRVPLSWLKDYVDIDVSIAELAERLTLAGLDVETIEYIGLPGAELEWDPEKIVVGEIRSVRFHPKADRLTLVEVDYGGPETEDGGSETEIVVSGPPSLLPLRGQDNLSLKVAFAMEGVKLYDGHAEGLHIRKLKKSKIRGVVSRAMVCSEKELGLSDEHEDIIYLPDDAPVGMPLVEYLGDAVLDIDIKGPFAHLQSVFGVAREAAALLGVPLKRDVIEVLERHPAELTPTPDFVTLEIPDPDLCPRYSAFYIQGIELKPSPFWMQMRLLRAGMRPISNIVDISNYVMLELGQPLHAFDYHILRPKPGDDKPVIIVRRARDGEQMRTLDGELRTFDKDMLLISDGGGPVAIGGVMGGMDSEVTDATTDILLEAAHFDFLNTRRTSRLLGLTSEASIRLGRRVDPELTTVAAARAAHLMAELGGGTVVSTVGDLYPGRQSPCVIEFDTAYADRILGIEVPTDDITRILTSLEFEVSPSSPGHLTVTVPSYRLDVTRPIDLVEEVGRVWGYDRFPTTLMRDELPPQRANPRLEGAERVRDLLVGCGLDEVITYSLVDMEDEGNLWPQGSQGKPNNYLRVRNPLSADRAYLRQTLLPSMLHTTRENLRFLDQAAIFEIGAVYLPVEGSDEQADPLPHEPRRLSVVMTGPREARSWMDGQDRGSVDFYALKGVVETLLSGLGLEGTFELGDHPALHPGRSAQVNVALPKGDSVVVGAMGELHPAVLDSFDLAGQPVCALEFDLDKLLSAWGTVRSIVPISVHPPVYEDLAVVVDENVSAVRVRDLIAQTGSSLVRSVVLFDVYRGEQVGIGKKSLAYRLTYQADNRTLTDREVAKLRGKIVRRIEREIDATLRS
ncbi:MAG: phenylalanine--tRNA ligase subunit beta [Chloroflexi bacterium]|nr:phenylalanine--tRNA ligase subunit beta [Chloroflexota bacterium]